MINKLISVWRGNQSPPTNYHLWLNDKNLSCNINGNWVNINSFSELYNTLIQLINLKLDKDSPILLGNPTAPTQDENDNSTKIATTEFVLTLISNLKQNLSLEIEENTIKLGTTDVTIEGGNKLNVTSSENVITINHDEIKNINTNQVGNIKEFNNNIMINIPSIKSDTSGHLININESNIILSFATTEDITNLTSY